MSDAREPCDRCGEQVAPEALRTEGRFVLCDRCLETLASARRLGIGSCGPQIVAWCDRGRGHREMAHRAHREAVRRVLVSLGVPPGSAPSSSGGAPILACPDA
jgi:hypothetical protein